MTVSPHPTKSAQSEQNHVKRRWVEGRVFTTTMGAATDLVAEGSRRMLVNACYWALGMDGEIPAKSVVDCVGKFEPTPFGFGKYVKGVMPASHEMKKGAKRSSAPCSESAETWK